MNKTLILDLDNTLYDWVTFYATAFDEMVRELSLLLCVEKTKLLDEFKQVHQGYRNTEQPFAALDLPSVKSKYAKLERSEVATKLERAFRAFNQSRNQHLRLYPGVLDTLCELQRANIKVIGFTDSFLVNAYDRLSRLDIQEFFCRLYATGGDAPDHPFPETIANRTYPRNILRTVLGEKRKPDPAVLLEICDLEKLEKENTWYVGDSITRDIRMAKAARIKAVWARYGIKYDSGHWDLLVAISHWTSEDVEREEKFKQEAGLIEPDYIIDEFGEILSLLKMD